MGHSIKFHHINLMISENQHSIHGIAWVRPIHVNKSHLSHHKLNLNNCNSFFSGSWTSDTMYYPWNELQARDLFQIYYILKGNEYIKYNVTNQQVRTTNVSI